MHQLRNEAQKNHRFHQDDSHQYLHDEALHFDPSVDSMNKLADRNSFRRLSFQPSGQSSKAVHRQFLRKRMGGGGSPTTHDVKHNPDADSDSESPLKFESRKNSVFTVRKRDGQGSYRTMIVDESAQQLGSDKVQGPSLAQRILI